LAAKLSGGILVWLDTSRAGLRMILTAAMRRLGPWLIGLFLIAQIFGVVPLMSCHSAHAAGGNFLLSACEDGPDTHSPGHHHPGDSDDAAHHHALQDLNGVLAWVPDRNEIALVHIAVTPRAARALTEADPVLLERPPRPFLSI
jgi:hypothetical protein